MIELSAGYAKALTSKRRCSFPHGRSKMSRDDEATQFGKRIRQQRNKQYSIALRLPLTGDGLVSLFPRTHQSAKGAQKNQKLQLTLGQNEDLSLCLA
jgi:hypothetical protein